MTALAPDIRRVHHAQPRGIDRLAARVGVALYRWAQRDADRRLERQLSRARLVNDPLTRHNLQLDVDRQDEQIVQGARKYYFG